MREAGYVTAQIFNKEQLKLLNETIQKNPSCVNVYLLRPISR